MIQPIDFHGGGVVLSPCRSPSSSVVLTPRGPIRSSGRALFIRKQGANRRRRRRWSGRPRQSSGCATNCFTTSLAARSGYQRSKCCRSSLLSTAARAWNKGQWHIRAESYRRRQVSVCLNASRELDQAGGLRAQRKREAHKAPCGMATKHPKRSQGQGGGRRPHPKSMALLRPERRVASARRGRVGGKNALNNPKKSEHRTITSASAIRR
jgi:hypothetical protein